MEGRRFHTYRSYMQKQWFLEGQEGKDLDGPRVVKAKNDGQENMWLKAVGCDIPIEIYYLDIALLFICLPGKQNLGLAWTLSNKGEREYCGDGFNR